MKSANNTKVSTTKNTKHTKIGTTKITRITKVKVLNGEAVPILMTVTVGFNRR
jgi:hypothetical protein